MSSSRQPLTEVEPTFGARLREERKRLGMTQLQLATAVGISAPTQVGYERGYRVPDVHYLTAIEQQGLDACYVGAGTRATKAAARMLDWVFFGQIYALADQWLAAEQLEMSTEQRVEVSRLLYELLIDSRDVHPGTVERVLKLVVSNT